VSKHVFILGFSLKKNHRLSDGFSLLTKKETFLVKRSSFVVSEQ